MENSQFLVSGIQQIGVGTTSVYKSWKWFADMFGVDIRILEDDTVAERMLPYTGGKAQKRHAAIALNLQGGGGFEIWQYSDRKPKPVDFDIQVGDLGIFCAKLKCIDIEAAHKQILAKWDKVSPITEMPDGTKTFYVTDLEGNWFQMVPDSSVVVNENKLFGGMVGAMIGVTNIEKSLEVYRDVLGYDVVVYDKTGTFNDLSYLLGGDTRFRRVLLKWSKPVEGAFSSMFTSGYIELVQALERIPKKIFEGRYWGDPGFIQVCYDITNMDAFGEHCKQKGYPFTVDSCPDGVQFNMGDASGRFTYIEDPDGTLIEFVETYRVGIAKKLNLYLNLMKRNRKKPLPKFLFKAMRMNRMKFKD